MTANLMPPRAALLTPAGMAAIAVIAIRGEGVVRWLAPFVALRRGKPLEGLALRSPALADFEHEEGVREEVVLLRREENFVEIQCHGGAQAASSILRRLAAGGAAILSAAEWALEEEACPIRAAARLQLSQCTSPQGTRVLLDQFRGALRREIETIAKQLQAGDVAGASEGVARLLERSRIGLRLASGFRVALVGRPNVGKSSLLNALLGFGRAIVFDEPGTTRDVVTAAAAFGGWAVTLQDLAGLRDAVDPIEREGVRKAREAAGEADLVLLVADASQPWGEAEEGLAKQFPGALMVHNKCDLPRNNGARPQGVCVSATTGEGLEALQEAILKRLLDPPLAAEEAVPFVSRQVELLREAQILMKSEKIGSARERLLRVLARETYA